MSGRVFQNIVLQFKDAVDTEIGVIDAEGTVIACTELSEIGSHWSELVSSINDAEESVIPVGGKTFKALSGWNGHFDFAVFAYGENEMSRAACSMAAVALNAAKSYYEEKYDKVSFIKNIISDNIMLSDLYIRAKELHVETELNRGVFLIRRLDEHFEGLTVEAVQNIFPDRQTSFALSMGESDVVLIQQLGENVGTRDLEKTAQLIEETLRENGESTVVVGIGTVAAHLRDLAKSYKEAQIAIEVGKVFDTEKYVVSYENPIDSLDKETLFTINKFFENNLVLSETARKLFVHRNTLVYRLEKIKKLTGLDLREFDDAITFKVALMVKKYLASRGIEA